MSKRAANASMAGQRHSNAQQPLRTIAVQDKNSNMCIDLTSDSDDTLMGDSKCAAAKETALIDLTSDAEEEPVPESEKTAENGWIEILPNPNGTYDYDNDPAGLYGGREVDDRPSLIDFYHQDARTNRVFARMAPTKAALAATKAEVQQSAPESTVQATPSSGRPPVLKLRPAASCISPATQRSYADALTGNQNQISTPASRNRKENAPRRLAGSRGTRAKDEVCGVSDSCKKNKAAPVSANEENEDDVELKEAIDASLALDDEMARRGENEEEIREAVRISKG